MVTMEERPGVRQIESVEELRALADPLRLAILAALDPQGPDAELPVMSVKELAQRLDEPQTKLYRHVKQLEATGLIHVAATRVVSGIVEQRYQASQRSLRLSRALVSQHADEALIAVRSVFDTFFAGLEERARKDGPGKPILYVGDSRVTPEAAARIGTLIAELTDEISRAEAGDVPISVAIGFYRPE
jgi:DNA-binding transcriptional ArsR family regulator